MQTTALLDYAPNAWKLLHGVFCVYKPTEHNIHYLRQKILLNLVRDLNALEVRKPREIIKIEGSLGSDSGLSVSRTPSYADNVLVVGQRYDKKDFACAWAGYPGKISSGLVVFGIGRSAAFMKRINANKLVRTYEIEGQLGIVTDDLTVTGKVLEKASFRHMTEHKLELMLQNLQATHQTVAYEYAGVPLVSQEAYDMASKGLVRPEGKSEALIYGIRCIKFEPPDFTIEVHCINENEGYLKELVNNIGMKGKCWAATSKIRCTRHGPFTLEHALVRKHWTLEHIISNIEYCRPLTTREHVEPISANLRSINPN